MVDFCSLSIAKVLTLFVTLNFAEVASDSGASFSCLKILSYNVWFREDLELNLRMRAIGHIVQLHSPHLICFQVSFLHFQSAKFRCSSGFRQAVFVWYCRKLLQRYMIFSASRAGGKRILVLSQWMRHNQEATSACW